MTRQTVILPKGHRDKLNGLTAEFGLTQGEVVEVLLDNVDASALAAKRDAKAAAKTKRSDVAKSLKGLSKDDLKEVQAMIAAKKGEK